MKYEEAITTDDPLYYHNQARYFSAHPRVTELDVDMDFDYRQIIESVEIARADGFDPSSLVLGVNEMNEILKDSNLISASNLGNKAGRIGQIAGVEVEQHPAENASVLLAESEGEYAYYIV